MVLDLLYDADLDRIRGQNSPLDYELRLDLLVERWNQLKGPFLEWASEVANPLDRVEAVHIAELIPAWLAHARHVVMAPTSHDPEYNRVHSNHAMLVTNVESLADRLGVRFRH